jgi:hypothetical protein
MDAEPSSASGEYASITLRRDVCVISAHLSLMIRKGVPKKTHRMIHDEMYVAFASPPARMTNRPDERSAIEIDKS